MKFLKTEPGSWVKLADQGGISDHAHLFDQDTIEAVNAAIAARRPLLVRGEPGIGKSQLARAVAKELKRAFVPQVVDIRTESRDLLWYFDAVERLAEAQISAVVGGDNESVRARLNAARFLRPGALWWAFDWKNAQAQAKSVGMAPPPQPDGGIPNEGCVVLIDEIDKAETDVPNGLLEALGSGGFVPFGSSKRVSIGEQPPLIVITSNEERAMPDAFVRRCLVLHLKLPEERSRLIPYLVERGRVHFDDMDDKVLSAAAEQLADDRQQAISHRLSPLPGQAEYLDLLRAIGALAPKEPEVQLKKIKAIENYTLQKHQGAI